MWLRDLCLGSINHGILAKDATKSGYATYFTYVYCYLKMYVTDRTVCKDEYILAHVVAEDYAAFLPEQMKIEEESAARLHFATVVRSALKSVKASKPDFTSCFPQGLTYESYEQNREFEIGYKEGSVLKKYPDPFKSPADFRAKVSVLLEFNNKKADVGALFVVAYDIVLMLALMMLPMRSNLPKEVLFLTFATFSKKGLVSADYIQKIETTTKEELQLGIKLDENQIKKLWKYFEPRISSAMMEHCVKMTLAGLPEESVRLRNLVGLCRWHGLTCYRAVKQAFDLPGFPWDQLLKIPQYKTEMEAFEEAAKLVGDNSFYGYNPTMGKAKSVHYKNLASVCARILVETKESPALDKAACFVKSYQSKDIVDGLITRYVRQVKSTDSKVGQPHGDASTVSKGLTSSARKAQLKTTQVPSTEYAAKPGPGPAQASTSNAQTNSKSNTQNHKPKPSVEHVGLGWPDALYNNCDRGSDVDIGWPDALYNNCDSDSDEDVGWPDVFGYSYSDIDSCDDPTNDYLFDFDDCINGSDALDSMDSD